MITCSNYSCLMCLVCNTNNPFLLILNPALILKTRRRMARERRGAGSSLVSMETQLYIQTIYERCVIGSREEEYQDKIVRSARQ